MTEIEVDPRLALVIEARKYLGVKEQGSNNGDAVRMFQFAVDKKAQGEPWCMAFVQFLVKAIDDTLGVNNVLYPSEHVLTVWNKTSHRARKRTAAPGYICVWQMYDVNGKQTPAGHCGVVIKKYNEDAFETIEGNTSAGPGIKREGDGVYKRIRRFDAGLPMKIKGFLDPWERLA